MLKNKQKNPKQPPKKEQLTGPDTSYQQNHMKTVTNEVAVQSPWIPRTGDGRKKKKKQTEENPPQKHV